MPKLVKQVLIYNPLISIFAFVFVLMQHPRLTPENYLITLIVTEIIGTTIAIPMNLLSRKIYDYPTWKKLLTAFGVIYIFGSIGSALGIVTAEALFPGMSLKFSFQEYFVFNLILSVVFGIVVSGYLYFKYRLDRAVEEIKEYEVEKERVEKLKKEAELEALRSNIDPHFLFNTLNSIASLIREDPQKAETMVEQLSALFRYTLFSREGSKVKLSEELEVIKRYLEIEKTRLGSRLRYNMNIPEETLKCGIPPLLLQPLIENAVKHGIAKLEKGGMIEISARISSGVLHISVSNDSAEAKTEEKGRGFGLRSVRERLYLIYGDKAALKTEESEIYKTVLTIPAEEDSNEI